MSSHATDLAVYAKSSSVHCDVDDEVVDDVRCVIVPRRLSVWVRSVVVGIGRRLYTDAVVAVSAGVLLYYHRPLCIADSCSNIYCSDACVSCAFIVCLLSRGSLCGRPSSHITGLSVCSFHLSIRLSCTCLSPVDVTGSPGFFLSVKDWKPC